MELITELELLKEKMSKNIDNEIRTGHIPMSCLLELLLLNLSIHNKLQESNLNALESHYVFQMIKEIDDIVVSRLRELKSM